MTEAEAGSPRDRSAHELHEAEREPRPGERCECGRPAVVVYRTAGFGDVPWCGESDDPSALPTAAAARRLGVL